MTSWKDFSLHHRQMHYSIIISYRRFHCKTKIQEIQYDVSFCWFTGLSLWLSIEGKQKIIFQDNCKLNWSNGMSYFNAHALTPANVTFISDNIFQINVSIVSDVCLKENWACTTADFLLSRLAMNQAKSYLTYLWFIDLKCHLSKKHDN